MVLAPLRISLAIMACCVAGAGANFKIPAGSGAVVVDGQLEEPLWRSARSFSLNAPDYGAAFPAGGEARAVVCGAHLCLGARLPESGRVIAISQGVSPSWWREDMLVWTFAVNFNNRPRRLTLTVNPMGAYSVDSSVPDAGVRKGVLAAARAGANEWTVEAAIPLDKMAPIGYVTVERVRVPRPDAPELRWQWPAPNERMDFELLPSAPSNQAAPAFQPAPLPAVEKESRTFTGLAAELAAESGRIWPEAEGARIEAAFQYSLRRRMAKAAEAERIEWEKVKTRADWEQFRDQRVAALRKSLGPFPERTPLRAEATRRADYGDGFLIENVVYESVPGRVVAANLYLPSRGSGPFPAVVLVHSHHAPRTQSELQDMGMTWARAGVAVLAPDQPGAGERVESQAWLRESYYSRYAMGMQLYLAGESLMKWMVWDLMRGIDLLLERPTQIDRKRIVMLGSVAGGGDPAAVTAALDSRIGAVIPFNFGEAGPEEHYTRGPRPYGFDTADPGWGYWETTRNLRRGAADQFFPWLICASVAPRPFLFSFEIGWPKTVEEEPAWARYKKVYELYGELGKLAAVEGFGPFPGPGEFTNVGSFVRRRIYPVLKRWLDMPVPDSEYHSVKPDGELMAITPKIAAERRPKTTAALALALAQARLKSARVDSRMLRSAVAARLGDIEPAPSPEARIIASKPVSKFALEAISLEAEPGVTLAVLLLKPGGVKAPLVLAFAQEGKRGFLSHRAPEIVGLLERGIAVCLADVRGTGELASKAVRGPGGMSPAATELMLANTLLGARVKDARTIFRYLSSRPDIEGKRIGLWGDSFGAVNPRDMLFDKSVNQPGGPEIPQAEPLGPLLALLTALYEPDAAAVAARRGVASFVSVLEDRFLYLPLDAIVPGILEAGDLPDIAAAIGPRPVFIQAAVDGRNRPLTLPEIRAASPVPPNTTLREEPDAGMAPEWIGGRLR